MKRSFHTKVDAWLVVVMALPVLFIGYELIIDFSWFLLLPFAFIIAIYAVTLPCYYTIENQHLKIRAGIIIKKDIDIQQISRIAESNDPISSPAMSLKRLRIDFGQGDYILISPQNRKAFIELLSSVNPNIECLK